MKKVVLNIEIRLRSQLYSRLRLAFSLRIRPLNSASESPQKYAAEPTQISKELSTLELDRRTQPDALHRTLS
jgi:hypothetical protein